MMEVDNTPNRTPKYEATKTPKYEAAKTPKYEGTKTSKYKHQTANALANQSTSARDIPPARTRNRRPDKQLYVPKAKRGEPSGKPVMGESPLASPAVPTTPPAKIKNSAKAKRTSVDSRRTPRPTSKPPAITAIHGSRTTTTTNNNNTAAADSLPTASSESDDRATTTTAPSTPTDQPRSGDSRPTSVKPTDQPRSGDSRPTSVKPAEHDTTTGAIPRQDRPLASPKIATQVSQSLTRASHTDERTMNDDRAATYVVTEASATKSDGSATESKFGTSGSDDPWDVSESVQTTFGGDGALTEEVAVVAMETRTLDNINANTGEAIVDISVTPEEPLAIVDISVTSEERIVDISATSESDSAEVMEVIQSEDEVSVKNDAHRVGGGEGVPAESVVVGPSGPDGDYACEPVEPVLLSPLGCTEGAEMAAVSPVIVIAAAAVSSPAASAASGGISSVNGCEQGNDEDDTWDAMYDENGDCLDPELEMQISKTFGQVSIQVPHLDYLAFKPKKVDLSDEEYGHVIEIYDFPAEFKTQDLLSAFLKFQDKGFDIKWVDDTHALGVFASKIAAKDALAICHPFIKTRPLSQATPESRQKARRRSEFLQPYKARPQTTAAMARRLVSSALGLNLPVSKETREVERKKLLEAKERRKLAAKQKEAAWDGLIGSAE